MAFGSSGAWIQSNSSLLGGRASLNRRPLGSLLVLALLCGLSGALRPIHAQNPVSIVTEVSKRPIKSRTEPVYPSLARQLHILGKVKLQVTVAADGSVTATKVMGGSPILVKSVSETVKEWKYEPEAKESTETVEFTFSSS
jgi:TonB family protein